MKNLSYSKLKEKVKKANRKEYYALLDRARERMPTIRLAGDMIVGFPGETEEDHQQSMELLRRAQYKSCFIFKYSPRPGTVSSRRLEDDVPDAVKKQRNHQLLRSRQRQYRFPCPSGLYRLLF